MVNMLNYPIYIKIFFTLIILFFYLFLRNIPLPGIESFSKQYQNESFIELVDVVAGSSITKYSILSLNITPMITSILVVQVYWIVYTYLKKGIIYKPYSVIWGDMSSLFLYVFIVVSFVFSILYLQYLNIYTLSYVQFNYLLYIIHLVLLIFILVVGSFVVLLLAQLINLFGLGKGFSCLILTNLILSLYNLGKEYLIHLPRLYICILIIQCICVLLFVSLLENMSNTVFMRYGLGISFFNMIRKYSFNLREDRSFIYSLSTLSIFPIIIVNSWIFLFKPSLETGYDVLYMLFVETFFVFIIYIFSLLLLKRPLQYIRYLYKNSYQIGYSYRVFDMYRMLSLYVIKSFLLELCVLLIIILSSKIIYIVCICDQYLSISGSLGVDVIGSIYLYNNNFMLLFLICIRLVLFILKKTEFAFFRHKDLKILL